MVDGGTTTAAESHVGTTPWWATPARNTGGKGSTDGRGCIDSETCGWPRWYCSHSRCNCNSHAPAPPTKLPATVLATALSVVAVAMDSDSDSDELLRDRCPERNEMVQRGHAHLQKVLRERARMCVCVYVYMCVCMCVYVCVACTIDLPSV